jgi:hypothetical protein
MIPRNLAARGLASLWASALRFAANLGNGAVRAFNGRQILANTSRARIVSPMADSHMKTNQIHPVSLSGLSMNQVEELLDWLENHGVCDSQVEYVSGQGFTVRHS